MREFEPYAFTGTEYKNCIMDGRLCWMQKVTFKSLTYSSITFWLLALEVISD